MPITTTTLADVIDGMADTVRGLAPTMMADRLFDLCPGDRDLRVFAASSTEATLRKFQAVPVGSRQDPLVLDSEANHYGHDVEFLVSYPAKLYHLYGREGRRDIERVIKADESLLWDAFYDSGNLVPGSILMPEIQPVDRSDDDVWFLTILVHVQWFEAKNLTT